MELFPQQLPYPYVYLSLIYLLYYYVVAIVPADVEQNGTTKIRTQTTPNADCGPTICSTGTIHTRD